MPRSDNLYQIPNNLPVPVDDGVCNHLTGMSLPSVLLISTSDRLVEDLVGLSGRVVIYCCPRTGRLLVTSVRGLSPYRSGHGSPP